MQTSKTTGFSRRHSLPLPALACLMALAGPASATETGSAELLRALNRAATVGTPLASGVTVKSPHLGVQRVGQPFELEIEFSGVGPGGASASFSSDNGLQIAHAAPRDLPAGRSTVKLSVNASANGLRFVNVFTRQNGAGAAISIPVQIGPAEETRKPQPQQRSPEGRLLQLLPLRE